jgi:hypothetical protein
MLWFGLATVPIVYAAVWAFGSPPASPPEQKAPPRDMVVHEWGTFLGMSGADGTWLDGMYHEEHALPAFVHARSRDQLRLGQAFLKGETPVIYFYTGVRQPVEVSVGFPHGIWTQWYPQAGGVLPSLVNHAEKPDRLTGGRIYWSAEVIPASAVKANGRVPPGAAQQPELDLKLPATSSDALWNHARQVDAAFVKTVNYANDPATPEFERFLFYRGLGEARLPLRFDEGRDGTLTLDSDQALDDPIRHIFVLRVEQGRGAYMYRPALQQLERADGVIPSMKNAQPLADFTRSVADALAARLTEVGLYAKEARAMVNTWTTSYFQTEGIRVLFVLPQSWTDAFIPMTIVPKPKQVVRVMVGRVELLTAERQRLAENAVRDLASPDSTTREQAYRFLNEQGRYVEPIVRRVLKTTSDDGVRTLCRRLLLTELVTELRAAVHNAADGKRLNTDPVLLRAQLARLLRQIGLGAEARAEGEAVLAALKVHPTDGNQVRAANPLALEIRGAALQAMGDDQAASKIYARRVELQAQAMSGNPADMAAPWFREWLRDSWVGRAYVQCVARLGTLDAAIAALQRNLAQPALSPTDSVDRRATRMLLALLFDAQGKPALAESQLASPAGNSQSVVLSLGCNKVDVSEEPLATEEPKPIAASKPPAPVPAKPVEPAS